MKIQKQFTVQSRAEFKDKASESTTTPVIISNANTLFEKLERAIEDNNKTEFNTLITSDFIYPGNGKKENNNELTINDYDFIYNGDHHERYFVYEYYWVRPNIEALFWEHHELFRRLVSHLAEFGNADLHNIFVKSVQASRVPNIIFSNWDEKQKDDIKDGIGKISTYGAQLVHAKVARGNDALTLADDLNKQLNELPIDNSEVKWLDFKYTFIKKLHSKDADFIAHRGWKEIITNVAATIFSVGILNLINYCTTGSFLFFVNTATQNLVCGLDNSIKPEFINPTMIR
jgi:hypothetical protein